jgi:folylpolyglutamate synthase/dihydropteroate synthase
MPDFDRLCRLEISEDKFLRYFWECWNRMKEKVTEHLPMAPLFQFLTVLAFKIFISEKVDVAIIEVGLGGTNDSTNVVCLFFFSFLLGTKVVYICLQNYLGRFLQT